MKRIIYNNKKWILTALFIVLILFAWTNRFIQDDAFISFRYAKNWVNGYGLVWNPGERTEGYTNFLWTLLIGIGMKLGMEPISFSYLLGILCFTITIFLTYRLSILLFNSQWIGILIIFLLGTNFTFSSFATGGMETQLQSCLFVASVYIVLHSIVKKQWDYLRLIGLSIILSLAVLTRLDSSLCYLVIFISVICFIFKENHGVGKKVIKISLFLLPFLIIVGGWFLWKLSYYGNIVPNTYFVKLSSIMFLKIGAGYIYLFLLSYGFFPFLIYIPLFFKKIWMNRNAAIIILVSIIMLWMVYVIRAGGDFIEFRFMVPILPFIILLLIWLIRICITQQKVQWIFIIFMIASSIHHQFRFERFIPVGGVESVRLLKRHLFDEDEAWVQIGKVLKKAFQNYPEVTIATTACGAIPFYSDLKTVDMYGLSDSWIARNGQVVSVKPGHNKITTFSYLIDRRVNLVIGHPFMKSISDTSKTVWFGMLYKHIEDKRKIPSDSYFLEIPVNGKYKLVVYYLTQDPTVDQVIQENHWITYPVYHEQSES